MKIPVSLMGLIAFLLVALSGPFHKFGIIELVPAFIGLIFGVFLGIVALISLILQALFKRNTLTLGRVIMAVIVTIAIPFSIINKAKSVPPIHDISTDLVNPPDFVAIAPLRADPPNPVTYDGIKTAQQQRIAYPELKTLNYSQPKSELISAVEQAVKNLGWKLVNIDANQVIVEATDTTAWFGFKDDIVVRVSNQGGESVVDICSKSRVGGSDLGKNAERIHSFIEALDGVLGE